MMSPLGGSIVGWVRLVFSVLYGIAYSACLVRFTDDQMNDEIDRIRKENGWKPRKRGKPGRRGRGSGSSNGGEAPNNTAAADEHVKLLQKLQVRAENIYSGSSKGGETSNNSAAADEHVKLIQKLQVSA